VLGEQGLRGFYYPDRRGDSLVVLDKLRGGCRCSLNFVQLLANEMWRPLPLGRTNYCHFEYQLAERLQLPLLFFCTGMACVLTGTLFALRETLLSFRLIKLDVSTAKG